MQLLFNSFIDNKKKVSDIKIAIKDALKLSTEYQELAEKIADLKKKQKQIEFAVKSDFAPELDKIDALLADISADENQMTLDALVLFGKGEEIVVKDQLNNEYTADFKVRFKRKK